MPTCFVPNCKSGYASELKYCKENNLKPASKFKAPSDPEMLKEWQRSIPRLGLSPSDWVCEKHFSEKVIERYFRTKLLNNKEHLIERERPILLPGAVPTKFPDCPKYLNQPSPLKRKAPKDRNAANNNQCAAKRRKLSTIISSNDNVDGIQPLEACEIILEKENQARENVPPTPSALTFDILQRHDTARVSWFKFYNQEEKVVRFLHWPKGQSVLVKYVDICENLSAKIFFGSVSSSFVDYEKIDNLDQLQKLFDVVETTNVCPGAVLNKFNNCRGYLSRTDVYCSKCKLSIAKAAASKKTNMKKAHRINHNMKRKLQRLTTKVPIA